MQSALIALLEWELAASLAREDEWRARTRRLMDDAHIRPGGEPAKFSSGETRTVKARLLASLRALLDTPPDDTKLRQRLEAARWEAMNPPEA